MENGFEATEICAVCGGACCKANGCSLSPEDMLRELEEWKAGQTDRKADAAVSAGAQIESWLQESKCAIDSFAAERGRCYYIRMRHKCFTFIGVDAMGECIALTDQGCSLPFAKRPRGGRYLEGRQDRRCLQHYTREQMIADWEPYQQILQKIWDTWHDRLEQEGIFDRCEEDYMQYQRKKRQAAVHRQEKGGKE